MRHYIFIIRLIHTMLLIQLLYVAIFYVNGLFQFDTRPILSDQNRFQTRFEGRIFHCIIHKCIKDIYIYLT